MAIVEIEGFEILHTTSPQGPDVISDRYTAALFNLLPRGRIWPREDGTTLASYVRGYGTEASRVERRGLDLLRQLDPREAFELLESWERVLDLPDCEPSATTTWGRQGAAHSKLTALALSSKADYVAAAANLGYTITIENATEGTFELAESEIGDEGDEIGDPWWQFRVITQSGSADAQLRCLLEQQSPLHTEFGIVFQ